VGRQHSVGWVLIGGLAAGCQRSQPAEGPTSIVAVHPAADSLPENLLRWYLEFSAPMFPGRALDHVRLIDDRGAEVSGAFLDLSEELWDPAGRRLTLLFDPGRVKQGIRTNLESGRPLRAGRHYLLQIDSAWTDAAGRPLSAGVDKRFVATAADHRGPDPADWRISEPAARSRGALEVDFGEPLDHALAGRLLALHDSADRAIDGSVELLDRDRRWRFLPAIAWVPGRYQLKVSPELEDVAGNRPGRPFDLELAGGPAPAMPAVIIRWVTVSPGR